MKRYVSSRSIVTSVLLLVVTCGIYSLVWIYRLSNDVSKINGEEEDGGKVLLLGLVTCGIYYIYWAYKMGENVQSFSGKNDGILYAIAYLFGLPVLTFCMIQKEINKFVEAEHIIETEYK